METTIELTLTFASLCTFAGGFFIFKKLGLNSIESVEGLYSGFGTDLNGNSILSKEVRVIALNKNEIEISSSIFPSFQTKLVLNHGEYFVSKKINNIEVSFNSDLKSLVIEDNKNSLSFAGFMKVS